MPYEIEDLIRAALRHKAESVPSSSQHRSGSFLGGRPRVAVAAAGAAIVLAVVGVALFATHAASDRRDFPNAAAAGSDAPSDGNPVQTSGAPVPSGRISGQPSGDPPSGFLPVQPSDVLTKTYSGNPFTIYASVKDGVVPLAPSFACLSISPSGGSDPVAVILGVGEHATIHTFIPAALGALNSSNPQTVSVSGYVLTAHHPGQVTITTTHGPCAGDRTIPNPIVVRIVVK